MGKQNKPRAAGTYNDIFEPYYAHHYQLPAQVKNMYPKLDVEFTSPAFVKEDHSFTTQEEMMNFLYELTKNNEHVRLEIIGHSIEGREIPLLIFSTNEVHSVSFKNKPTVWLQAQIHGNEPAAGESALIIAQQLAEGRLGEQVLNDINVVIVPRTNPDSGFYFERNSITQLNGNRDHLNLEMPELQVVHREFNKYLPEVVIDAHEYGAFPQYENIGKEGALKYHDVLLLTGKNLNIPGEIREKSDQWFIENAFKELEKSDYSYGSYYTVTNSAKSQPTLLEGGDDAGTGRNTFALKPSFSILVETLGIGIGRENFLRRVNGQVITHTSILQTTKQYAQEIKEVISNSRELIKEGGSKGKDNHSVILKSERQKVDGYKAKAIDIAKGEVVEFPVFYYSATNAKAKEKVIRPNAYILPRAFVNVVKKLMNHGVIVEQLTDDQTLFTQYYQVTERNVRNEGNRPVSELKTEIVQEQRYFPKGSYVIRSAQAVAYLVSLALEPGSPSSYFAQGFLPSYPKGELPVYRYIDKINFPLRTINNL